MSTSEPPLFLKTQLPSPLTTTTLERYVTVGGNQVHRRATIPLIVDQTDPELPLKVVIEFRAIQADTRLHLNTGQLRFEFFPQCPQGQARENWNAVLTDIAGRNAADFTNALTAWLAKYMEPTAFQDQKEYFLKTTKAFAMSVKDTATRVRIIFNYMQYMPGSPGVGQRIYSEVSRRWSSIASCVKGGRQVSMPQATISPALLTLGTCWSSTCLLKNDVITLPLQPVLEVMGVKVAVMEAVDSDAVVVDMVVVVVVRLPRDTLVATLQALTTVLLKAIQLSAMVTDMVNTAEDTEVL